MFLTDTHLHTLHSFDSQAQATEHLEEARKKGFSLLCITDHCDVNLQPFDVLRERLTACREEVLALREEAPPQKLLFGMELGEALEDLPYAEGLFSLFPYDYVIGSVHNIPGEEDFYFMDCSHIDVPALLTPYFEELIKLARWGQTDSIAHITYPLRYIEGDYGVPVDLSRYEDLIGELFGVMIEKGLALEVNSSGLRQKIGRPLPDRRLLERYFAQGGRKIILGSDAHKGEDFGKGIPECIALLKEIGFTEAVYYQNRVAHAYPLE